MKLHAQLTLDAGSLKPLDVFQTLHAVFEQQGFARREYCSLDNWRTVERAQHFRMRGSLFSEIWYGPIDNHRLDLILIDADADLPAVDKLLADLVARLSVKQAFLHSADYYHWQNAEQPLEYEVAGRDYSALPMVHNGLPPPLGAMWIDISRNPGRRFLRDGFQEAVSSPMWLRSDQLSESQVAEIRSQPGFEIATHETHYCVRHVCSPFDETTANVQEFLRAVCFR